jgi:hypothetical protein
VHWTPEAYGKLPLAVGKAIGGRSGAGLPESIGAGGEEFEEAEVAKDLELLADFVADVGVVGMEFGQNVSVSIYVAQGEFEFA